MDDDYDDDGELMDPETLRNLLSSPPLSQTRPDLMPDDHILRAVSIEDVIRSRVAAITSQMQEGINTYNRILEIGFRSNKNGQGVTLGQLQAIIQEVVDTKNKILSQVNFQQNLLIQRYNLEHPDFPLGNENPPVVQGLPLPGTPDSCLSAHLRETSSESSEICDIVEEEHQSFLVETQELQTNASQEPDDVEMRQSPQIIDCEVVLNPLTEEQIQSLRTHGKVILTNDSGNDEVDSEEGSLFDQLCDIEHDLRFRKFEARVRHQPSESDVQNEETFDETEAETVADAGQQVASKKRDRDRVMEWIQRNRNRESDSSEDSDGTLEYDDGEELEFNALASNGDPVFEENEMEMRISEASDIELDLEEDEETIRCRLLGLEAPVPIKPRQLASGKGVKRDFHKDKLLRILSLGGISDTDSTDGSTIDDTDSGPEADIIELGDTTEDEEIGVEFIEEVKRRSLKMGELETDAIKQDGPPEIKRPRLIDVESRSNLDLPISIPSERNAGRLSTSSSQGRIDIREIIPASKLTTETKLAIIAEKIRTESINYKDKMQQALGISLETGGGGLVLDFDPTTREPLVSVDHYITTNLKEYQQAGVKFMYNNCFESVAKATEAGSGCVLAHCMGLGKTLQTLAFCHTVLTTDRLNVRQVLVLAPLITVNNWITEYKRWIHLPGMDVAVYNLSIQKERFSMLGKWRQYGGIGVMNYESYTALIKKTRTGENSTTMSMAEAQSQKDTEDFIIEALVNPGPDILVCDEGHLLKNQKTQRYKTINKIKTKRKIMLTGTPIQNHLEEYYAMINLCKPNVLGNLFEFRNRYVNPINNGQHLDSTGPDVSKMKRRIYCLHRLVKGFVQRNEIDVLKGILPTKYEYVIPIQLSKLQEELYRSCVSFIARQNEKPNVLKYYHLLQKTCTHPKMLLEKPKSNHVPKEIRKEMGPRQIEDLEAEEELERNSEWIVSVLNGKDKTQISNDWTVSGKLIVLEDIINQCKALGEKLLVFSRYTTALDVIEQYLGHHGGWEKEKNYLRLDGSTSTVNKTKFCDKFNTDPNFKFFLISKLTGGLGINLHGANRVVLFDASFNPSEDTQSIFRVYRIGQNRPCYVYRLVAQGTIEERIYCRSVLKLVLSRRVVDSLQPGRHFHAEDVDFLFGYKSEKSELPPAEHRPNDALLRNVLENQSKWVKFYAEHDYLLADRVEERLDDDQKDIATKEIDEEKSLPVPKKRTTKKKMPNKIPSPAQLPRTFDNVNTSNANQSLREPQGSNQSQVLLQVPRGSLEVQAPLTTELLQGTQKRSQVSEPQTSEQLQEPMDTRQIQEQGSGELETHQTQVLRLREPPMVADQTQERQLQTTQTQDLLANQVLEGVSCDQQLEELLNPDDPMCIPGLEITPVMCEMFDNYQNATGGRPDLGLMDLLAQVQEALINCDPQNEDANVRYESLKSFAYEQFDAVFGAEHANVIMQRFE